MPTASRIPTALLWLFVLSGAAGLIYQAIWSHYLGLTLGHAAYAQTLVLAIFMGGMAGGAWMAARRSASTTNLLKAYAVIEAVIGVAGLVFHPLFAAYTEVSQDSVLPALSGQSAALYQWLSAALLILPQCVLLGATFPLMSAGYLRIAPGQDGQALGGLYFSNSVGAALGALVATFLLLPTIGMPGAMTVAAILNLLVAALAWWLATPAASAAEASPTAASGVAATPAPVRRMALIALAAACITGATSFVYEIVWVRLLSQALGTTLHSFELMLSAFILGLAFGGLWVRRRSQRIAQPIRYAGHAQVWMGVAALLSAPVFMHSFDWVHWMASGLPRTDAGYSWYNTGSVIIALLVMFPAAFFAGMTLPLFTMALLRHDAGEASIGRVYAANTLGAIGGVLLAVHVLVPALGLHLSLLVAGAVDIALGVFLLRTAWPGSEVAIKLDGALLASAAACVAALTLGQPDPLKQASGVFRAGEFIDRKTSQVAFLKDGKTSTIAVVDYPASGAWMISTNGKPDASLTKQLASEPLEDEITMLMAAALPLARAATPSSIGIIGWGSGLSTHTALGSPLVGQVDSIEIEPAMVEGARLFGPRVARAYDDPRSSIIIEDARTYFATGARRYDIIISEPSNPWVSGVASLFTSEFYAFLRKHLNDGGLLTQWLQSYEISDALLSRMVSAIVGEFPQTELYLTNTSDMLLLAPAANAIGPLDLGRLGQGDLRAELARVGLATEADYRLRRIGGGDVLRAYVNLWGDAGHSDFHPDVALNAPRSRFKQEQAGLLPLLVDNGLPVLDQLDGRNPPARSETVTPSLHSRFYLARAHAITLVDTLSATPGNSADEPIPDALARLLALSSAPIAPDDLPEWSALVAGAAAASIGHLPAEDLQDAWITPRWVGEGQPDAVRAVLAVYAAAAARDASRYLDAIGHAQALAGDQLAPEMVDQFRTLGMLGALATGQADRLREVERTIGRGVRPSQEGAQVRMFLLSWADVIGQRTAAGAGTP